MAMYSAILVATAEPAISGTQATGSAHAAINLGKRRTFAINADQDIHVAFGPVGMPDADATSFRIPQNQTFVFDTGDDSGGYISIYNNTGSDAHYSIMYLSKF